MCGCVQLQVILTNKAQLESVTFFVKFFLTVGCTGQYIDSCCNSTTFHLCNVMCYYRQCSVAITRTKSPSYRQRLSIIIPIAYEVNLIAFSLMLFSKTYVDGLQILSQPSLTYVFQPHIYGIAFEAQHLSSLDEPRTMFLPLRLPCNVQWLAVTNSYSCTAATNTLEVHQISTSLSKSWLDDPKMYCKCLVCFQNVTIARAFERNVLHLIFISSLQFVTQVWYNGIIRIIRQNIKDYEVKHNVHFIKCCALQSCGHQRIGCVTQ